MLDALDDLVATKTIENPEDVSQYGLDDPACTVTITTDNTTEILIGDETGMGGELYVSIGDRNVYLVSSDLIKTSSMAYTT